MTRIAIKKQFYSFIFSHDTNNAAPTTIEQKTFMFRQCSSEKRESESLTHASHSLLIVYGT